MSKINSKYYEELHKLVLDISLLHKQVIYNPINLKEEIDRLKLNLNSRPLWKYKVDEVKLKELKDKYFELCKTFKVERKNIKNKYDFYDYYLPEMAQSSLWLVYNKLNILEEVVQHERPITASNGKLRHSFFGLPYYFSHIDKAYQKALKFPNKKKIAEKINKKTIYGEATLKKLEEFYLDFKKVVNKKVKFPKDLEKTILNKTLCDVKHDHNPSATFSCTADPETKKVTVFASPNAKNNEVDLKFTMLHEFAGHGMDSIIFDSVLIPKKIASPVYGWAGVSTPNPFDPKAEYFADRIARTCMTEDEQYIAKYRRHVWLPTRARADYAYNFEGKTMKECMKIYEDAGMHSFAFQEVIHCSMFNEGLRAAYFLGNEYFDELEKKMNLSERDWLALILFSGKLPYYLTEEIWPHIKKMLK